MAAEALEERTPGGIGKRLEEIVRSGLHSKTITIRL
jgi:hypothetical protein